MSGLSGRAREVSLIAFWLTEVWFSRWSLREVPLCAFWEGIRTLVLCTVLSIVLCTGHEVHVPLPEQSIPPDAQVGGAWSVALPCEPQRMWDFLVCRLYSLNYESLIWGRLRFLETKIAWVLPEYPTPAAPCPWVPVEGWIWPPCRAADCRFIKKVARASESTHSIQLSGVGRWLAEHNIYLPPPPTP